MPTGPGKYDHECVEVLVATGAQCVIVAVVGGVHGNGFSMNALDPRYEKLMPAMLRAMADQIEGVS